jgi:tight adherence protein C
MTPVLAAGAVLLVFAALWEAAGALEGRLGSVLSKTLGRIAGTPEGSAEDLARRLGVGDRILRAGLATRLEPRLVVAAKAAGAGCGALVAMIALPVAPGRLALPLAVLLVIAGFLAPDALLERIARRRRERAIAALPDALDLLAVSAASGRDPTTALAEIARAGPDPLASELATAVAEVEAGASPRDALAGLRERVPGPEIGTLAAALERSRSHGSPLADQLHEQATSLRRDARRRVEEQAARAAPKIQLVVALVLVPSVLLMILAAIVAHSDALFGAF